MSSDVGGGSAWRNEEERPDAHGWLTTSALRNHKDDSEASVFDSLESDDGLVASSSELSLDKWRSFLSGGNSKLSIMPATSSAFAALKEALEEENTFEENVIFDLDDFEKEMFDDSGCEENIFDTKPTRHPALQNCSPWDAYDYITGQWPQERYPQTLGGNYFAGDVNDQESLFRQTVNQKENSPRATVKPTNQMEFAATLAKLEKRAGGGERQTSRKHLRFLGICWVICASLITFLFVHHFTTMYVLHSITGENPMTFTWYYHLLADLENSLFGTQLLSRSRIYEDRPTPPSFRMSDTYYSQHVKLATAQSEATRIIVRPVALSTERAITSKELADATADGGFWRWRLSQHRQYIKDFANKILSRKDAINCRNDTFLMASSACYFDDSLPESNHDFGLFNFVSFGNERDPYGPRQYAAYLRGRESNGGNN